jgi:hypothetical protein
MAAGLGRRRSRFECEALARDWRVGDPESYVYLLGCYLGDGHVCFKPPGSWTLRVSCDRAFPGIEGEILAAVKATFPEAPGRRRPYAGAKADIVSVSHPAPCRWLFPSMAPGTSTSGRSASTSGSKS